MVLDAVPNYSIIAEAAAAMPSLAFRTSVLAPFKQDYDYALRAGWDGVTSHVALTPNVIQLAERLVSEYGTTTNVIEIGPGKDGSLSFVWDDHHGKYIYLDVGPNDTVHLYYDVDGEKWEGLSIARDPRILQKLARAFGRANWRPITYHWVVFATSSNSFSSPFEARPISAST